jgi:hypothetical protein
MGTGAPRAGRRVGARRAFAGAVLAGALLGGGGPAAGAGEGPDPDAPILRRIQDLRARAAKVRLDGRLRDWEGIPSYEDRDPSPVRDPSLDIVRISVAPRDDDLLVAVETAAPPSRSFPSFGLDVDFLGMSARDASIHFGAAGTCFVQGFPEGEKPVHVPLRRIDAEVSEGVEVRIPLDAIAGCLGPAAASAWRSGARRSFVRVQAWSEAGEPLVRVDEGPAAASFRLAAAPAPLDPPLPAGGEPRRAARLPLEGRWFVRQGADGLWSHKGLWAYDLTVEDHALQPTRMPGSRRLDDYYAWGRPVVAPEAGSVVFDSAPAEDHPPLEAPSGKGTGDTGNTLIVRLADGLRLSFGHLKRDSIGMPRGREFVAGDVLARVGNSGDSGAPHLHLSLHDRPGEFIGLPLAFKDVRVGLNPGSSDPWTRDLPSWAVREGWFVESR